MTEAPLLKMEKNIFLPLVLDWDGLKEPSPNSYAFFNSNAFLKIFNFTKKDAPSELHSEGYVRLSCNSRKIYLRYKALPPVKSGQVMLTYENLCKLGVVTTKNQEPFEVVVQPSCWWKFIWHNTNVVTRTAFRISFIGIIISIISIVFSIYSFAFN